MRIHRGLSLVEMLMAILILGIGVISVAALFPAGIAQQRQSVDDVIGPIVANNAIALLRTKLKQEDFGTFEEFMLHVGPIDFTSNYRERIPPFDDPTQPANYGDWGWMRPGFLLDDDPTTTTFEGAPLDERGAIDVFSWNYTADQFGLNSLATRTATERPGSDGVPEGEPYLFGIPYNTAKYPFADIYDGSVRPARVIIPQGERAYPMYAEYSTTIVERERNDRVPQYLWDVMFRRVEGRVQVAVFVYRVSFPPSQRIAYRVWGNQSPDNELVPPLPVKVSLWNTGGGLPWQGEPWDADADADVGNSIQPVTLIPGTDAGQEYDPLAEDQSWQAPRQWLVDQNGNVHRVLAGRRNVNDGPVELRDPVPFLTPPTDTVHPDFTPPSRFLVGSRDTAIQAYQDRWWQDVVTELYYIPAVRTVDIDGDGQQEIVTLTPVFVKVEEL